MPITITTTITEAAETSRGSHHVQSDRTVDQRRGVRTAVDTNDGHDLALVAATTALVGAGFGLASELGAAVLSRGFGKITSRAAQPA